MENIQAFDVGLFADRETLGEAVEYAHQIANATDNPPAVLTAVHVVLNTVLRIVREREADMCDDDTRAWGARV